MPHDALPSDLVAFLRGDRSLNCDLSDCEIGAFTFHPLDAVTEIELLLSTQGDEWIADDPYGGNGHYVVLAHDLLASSEDYDPLGLFVYVQQLSAYGSFDCDHESLIIYPDLTFTDFLTAPVRYINAAWGPDPEIAIPVNPIGEFPHRA